MPYHCFKQKYAFSTPSLVVVPTLKMHTTLRLSQKKKYSKLETLDQIGAFIN